ncbi:helix-turn-helix domain-containing protein [Micromonospora yangpuensis]|nr:helix-turn-helix domain-containing protein [Micromonospora yangpuensis]
MVDDVAAEVRRLRTEEQLSVPQIRARTGLGRNRVHELLRGVPPPDWTRRPNARDDLRAEAEALRAEGRTVPEIATHLGVSKSTAHTWVAHIPLPLDGPAAERRRAHARQMNEARWARYEKDREAARVDVRERAAEVVGVLSERDLLLLGAAIYWCEGTKSKPWRRDDRLQFVNTDPGLLSIFLAFLAACSVARTVPAYRVSIHESADAEVAARWWAARLDLPIGRFQRPTLKKHNPKTVRRNVGGSYHGCLVITVPNSSELYWRVEGMIARLFRISGGASR